MAQFLLSLFLSCTAFAQTADVFEKKLKTDPDNIGVRVKLAEIRVHDGQHAKAVELLNPYTDQLTAAGFRTLAFAYSALKNYTDEIRVLTIVSKKEEENHEWHMLLGQAYLKQASSLDKGNFEGISRATTAGIQQLRMTLKLAPKYKPAFDLLLKTFIGSKSHSEARELLIEGLNAFGPRPELYRELCRIDSNDGFLVQAVKECQESITLSPNYPDHFVFLIQALYDQKEEVRAEKQATIAAKRFPNSEFVQWAAGTMYLRKKNYSVAARYFGAAVKADPNSGRSQYGLAQALFESGDAKGALEHFMKACKSDHETIETFLSSGARLKQRGEGELGSKYTQAAYACRP